MPVSKGHDKTLFRLPGGTAAPTRLAVCEAGIDALSMAAIDRLRADTLYVATTGGMGPPTVACLDVLLRELAVRPGAVLVAATDADAQGCKYAARLEEQAAKAGVPSQRLLLPGGHNDWNDVLVVRRVSRHATRTIPHSSPSRSAEPGGTPRAHPPTQQPPPVPQEPDGRRHAMHPRTPDHRTIKHAHMFAGLGGGARGFNQAIARVGTLEADFRCLGGIDVDPQAIRDVARLAGVPGTYLDLFDQAQYRDFHGHELPPGWWEAVPNDVHRAFGGEHPHILFLSAPCKGFSGLLSGTKSKLAKCQALNRLTLRGIWLALEAYRNDPIELIAFENVPRIATRGRSLLDRITALLRAFGY